MTPSKHRKPAAAKRRDGFFVTTRHSIKKLHIVSDTVNIPISGMSVHRRNALPAGRGWRQGCFRTICLRVANHRRTAASVRTIFANCGNRGSVVVRFRLVPHMKNRRPNRFGFDPITDVQVLCPMNRGGLGARALNVELQKALNPPIDDILVERFGYTYRVGDKVMQTDNDYDKEVFNGDLGYVRRIDPDVQELTIEFDGRAVEYQFGELDQVALAYAVSIHKSQGSEYPAVVIPMMLRRNLLYTGITRGKKLVVLVGQKQAIGMAVKGKVEKRRWSKLGEWMS